MIMTSGEMLFRWMALEGSLGDGLKSSDMDSLLDPTFRLNFDYPDEK